MYYTPNSRYFRAEEFFPPEVISENKTSSGKVNSSIWRIFDWRVLWTGEKIREKFGTMVINDYLWGGVNRYRGFRPWSCILDTDHYIKTGIAKATFSSFTSQHCFGRAIDCKFKKYSAEEIREDIRDKEERGLLDNSIYKYITCVEDGVSWLHFDTRSWIRPTGGILWVKA